VTSRRRRQEKRGPPPPDPEPKKKRSNTGGGGRPKIDPEAAVDWASLKVRPSAPPLGVLLLQ
jgi:hypothetical protein